MPAPRSGSLLVDLLKIEHQLQADAAKPYERLQKRDREIGIELKHLKNNPVKQLRTWLGFTDDAKFSEETISRSNFLISSCLVIAGLVVGVSAGLALFFYTGEQPINIINVLAIGVGLQLLLLLLFVLTAIFNSQWLQNLLSGFNAGRWAARLAYIFPALKDPLDKLFNRQHNIADRKIIKWQTIYWSQQFAVAFNIALLLSCLYLVTFTDLAFGWSTTLNFDNSVVKSITDTLSWPWKTIFPAAVPDTSLIESTRFYRLKTVNMADESKTISQAQLAGNWWRFLLLSLLVYGFIPRLITLIIAKFNLNHSIKASILALPGLHLLLDRMNNPTITTVSETPEIEAKASNHESEINVTALTNRSVFFLHWGEPAFEQNIIEQWIVKTTGAQSTMFESVAADNHNDIPTSDSLPIVDQTTALAIVVKAWEPPTLELTDWLHELRKHYGLQQLIAVIAYDVGQDKQIKAANKFAIDTWHDFFKRQKLFDIELHGVRA